MKNILILTVCLLFGIPMIAQYITPGTGVNWTMGELAANSGGTIVPVSVDTFEITGDIGISASDTLSLFQNLYLSVHAGVLITIQGIMLTDPNNGFPVTFAAINAEEPFKGLKFDNSSGSVIHYTHFYHAGGIKLVNSNMEFVYSSFTGFDQSNCTGTIDLFQSSPFISGCTFLNNNGPAVMSAANGLSSPQIVNCFMESNVMSNTNMPQINLGTSGADSIRIISCQIFGNPENTMAGGIAITTLAGGSIQARIESNVIKNNRYGITAYGYSIGSVIRNNEIRDNNTQNLPMQGGSGINYWGNATNQSIVTGNIISGNLWGITIQSAAQPNLGQMAGEIYNPGMNQIYGNGNTGEVYDLYNNTPNPIMAENNYWGTMDPDSVEMHIFHQPDDPTLGLVDYLPLYYPPVGITENKAVTHFKILESVYPNPAEDYFFIKFTDELWITGEKPCLEIMDVKGEILEDIVISQTDQPTKFRIPEGISGIVLLRIKWKEMEETVKMVIK